MGGQILKIGGNLARPTQISKFTKSLLYIKKEVIDEVNFLCNERQSFLQIGTIIFDGCDQARLKYSK